MTRSGMEGVALDRRVSPVLVGCEESQTITKALREAGHEAYSCDLAPRFRNKHSDGQNGTQDPQRSR